MIPGVHETLRISGCPQISHDPKLIAESVVDGKPPKTILLAKVKTTFIRCGTALLLSCVSTDAHRANPKTWVLVRGTLENGDDMLLEVA